MSKLLFVVTAEWDLTDERAGIGKLRDWMHETAINQYAAVPGIVLKAWYSGPFEKTWGAIYIVDDPHALDPERLPRTALGTTGPIGVPPDRVRWLRLEALMEGMSGFTEFNPAPRSGGSL